ncbi:JmjC domain-containing protein, partial [Haematococcus lacustris]
RELYHSRFANKAPPKTQLEPMTDSDPVDYIDFTECMARNMPFRHADRRSNLYYAWMYAPEVNASPEVWEKIFGPGNNACPSLFDGVSTPGHLIQASSMEGHDYVLDVEKAAEHDFAAEPAQ